MRWTHEQIREQAKRGGVNREQVEQLLSEVERLRAHLWKVADAPRTSTDHEGTAMAVLLSMDLLNRIDSTVGYDEMGQ